MALPFIFLTFVDNETCCVKSSDLSNQGQAGPIFLKTYFVAF